MSRRVLFSCFPGYGHLHPLLPLAEAYRAHGYDVTIATGPDLVDRVERHGFRSLPAGLSGADTDARYLERFPGADRLPPVERLLTVLPNMFVDVAARSRIAELVAFTHEWKPDVVVHDVSEFAAPVAAALAGADLVTHGITISNPTADLAAVVRPAVERLYAEWGLDDVDAVTYGTTYLDLCPPSLQSAAPNPYPVVQPMRPVQPALNPRDRLPDAVQRLPYEKTVYVTLGTVVNDAPGVFEAVLAGLRDLPVNLVVTVGPDGDPDRFGRQPDSVHIDTYIPQALLLPHCAAVVSHAGAGTTLAALDEALPALLLPHGAEQFVNAATVAGAGAAEMLLPDQIDPAAVRAAVQRILTEPSYTAAARRIADELAVMPDPSHVVERLVPVRA